MDNSLRAARAVIVNLFHLSMVETRPKYGRQDGLSGQGVKTTSRSGCDQVADNNPKDLAFTTAWVRLCTPNLL